MKSYLERCDQLLNNLFNIVRHQNSHALEVRLHRQKENIHNAPSSEDIIQDVTQGKIDVFISKPAKTKKHEAP